MKKKILLAVLITLVLLGVGGTYAYFATDAFKSNKEMFFSYISSDICSNLKDDDLAEYIKKQENTPYTNKGDISVNVNGENSLTATEDETIQMLNNSKMSFEGKTDNNKKLAEQTITVNFAQGFNIPVQIRRDGESIGIQSNLLNTKFIALKNENLKTLFEKFGADSENIPDKIDFEKAQFTDEELKQLKDRYISVLYDNLEEDSFSKEKSNGQIVIKLNTSDKKCTEILIKMLEQLRDDEIILNKLSGTIDKEEFKQEINDEIDKIKSIDVNENDTLDIKMYIKSKKVAKIEINLDNQDDTKVAITLENNDNQMSLKAYEDNKLIGQLDILKEKEENDLIYTIKLNAEQEDEGKINANFTIKYKNIVALENVEESYDMTVKATDTDEESSNISLQYTNSKTFTNDIDIEGINNDNSIILNDATEDELDELLITIYTNLGLY